MRSAIFDRFNVAYRALKASAYLLPRIACVMFNTFCPNSDIGRRIRLLLLEHVFDYMLLSNVALGLGCICETTICFEGNSNIYYSINRT